jgi:hypothetical protein
MTEKIKLIWDFYGADALQTAKHHSIHLKEFAAAETLPFEHCDTLELGESHAIAFLVVTRQNMIPFRDALKPHRGQKA